MVQDTILGEINPSNRKGVKVREIRRMHWDDFLYHFGYKSVNSWLHVDKLSVFLRDVHFSSPWDEPFSSRFKINIILVIKYYFGLFFSLFVLYFFCLNFINNVTLL